MNKPKIGEVFTVHNENYFYSKNSTIFLSLQLTLKKSLFIDDCTDSEYSLWPDDNIKVVLL